MSLNLYLISQDQNSGYDTYSDAVVAAEDETKARLIHPGGEKWMLTPNYMKDEIETEYCWINENGFVENGSEWTSPDRVYIKLVGTAIDEIKEGVICASYHAG